MLSILLCLNYGARYYFFAMSLFPRLIFFFGSDCGLRCNLYTRNNNTMSLSLESIHRIDFTDLILEMLNEYTIDLHLVIDFIQELCVPAVD